MKKIGIAVFALMFAGLAYAGAQEVEIDFDGKSDIQDVENMDRVIISEGFQDFEYSVPVPKREVKEEAAEEFDIPVHRVFTVEEIRALNKSIDSAIASVILHKQGSSLLYSFERLRKYGTPEQKFYFVCGKSNLPYKFPKNFVMKLNRVQDKGIIDDVVEWVCTTVTHNVTFWNCQTENGVEICDPVIRKIVEEACGWVKK